MFPESSLADGDVSALVVVPSGRTATMLDMGSRVRPNASEDAIAQEVDMSPEDLRAALAESNGMVRVTTREGDQFMVTKHTVIEPLDE